MRQSSTLLCLRFHQPSPLPLSPFPVCRIPSIHRLSSPIAGLHHHTLLQTNRETLGGRRHAAEICVTPSRTYANRMHTDGQMAVTASRQWTFGSGRQVMKGVWAALHIHTNWKHTDGRMAAAADWPYQQGHASFVHPSASHDPTARPCPSSCAVNVPPPQ